MLSKTFGTVRLVLWSVVATGVSACAPLGEGFEIHVGEFAADSYDPIEFVGVAYGYAGLATLRIGNVGNGVLEGQIALSGVDTGSTGSGFSVMPESFVLDADERLDVAVSYFALGFEDASAELTLTHDGVGPSVTLECLASTDQDADDDGYSHEAIGGDDCNDRNAYVHPGAVEVWYDGIDQDCDEMSDFDADLDGYDRSIYGGTDCDDSDAEVYPGAKDVPDDGVDQDCDGDD